jgi:RNA polymerase sigma-70 factor (ECF subfamily)
LDQVGVAEPVWDEAAEQAELCQRALELIRSEFSPTTWMAFVGVMVEGERAAAVADRLQISPNAVYLARGRVLTRLRQELAGLWE